MSAQRSGVKTKRTYDTTSRSERAGVSRSRTLEVARQRFLANGYASTSVESIAAAARISPSTIYKSYGGKRGLARAVCEQALAGVGPSAAEERSNALRTLDDPHQVAAGWGDLVAEVAPRIAPLLLVLRDAARTDHEAAGLYDELDRTRLARMADNARHLAQGGHLRSGVTAGEARDVMWMCSSPELYDLLVRRRRWSPGKFGRFVADTITGVLIVPGIATGER